MSHLQSRLAQLTLANTGSERHFPDYLFDMVFRSLFPKDGSNPTLQKIFSRDIAAGVECLPHLGLPLDTLNQRVLAACQVALGYVLQAWQPLPAMLAAEKLAELPKAFGNSSRGFIGNMKLQELLNKKRHALLQQRNLLDGSDGTREIINGRTIGRFIPTVTEPTFEDYLELENVLRRLHMVCALEDAIGLRPFAGSDYDPDWRKLDDIVLRLYAAAYGRWVKPTEYFQSQGNLSRNLNRFSYSVFYLKNTQQLRAARTGFAKAFLLAYERGTLH